MNAPHIRSVDVAEDGVIVTYEDGSCAFYHESVLQAHLPAERVNRQRAAGVGRKRAGVQRSAGTAPAGAVRWKKRRG